jgi:hypothetical protein
MSLKLAEHAWNRSHPANIYQKYLPKIFNGAVMALT